MTDDLVQRLRASNGYTVGRSIAGYPMMHTDRELLIEAANEIERFRTAEFIGRLPDYVKELETERDEAYDRIRQLEDTVERLRESHR